MDDLPAISEQLSLAGLQVDEGNELLSIEADEASGRCNGARIAARKGLVAAILEARAQNFGTRTVAKAFKVSREVVRALDKNARASGELDHVKKELADKAYSLARMAIDRIEDEIDEMPRASLPIIAGVMIDKGQLLSGGVTSRVEKRETSSVADTEAWIKNMLTATPVEVVAQPVETGGESGQKALADGLASVIGIDQPGAQSIACDNQSPVYCPTAQGSEGTKAVDGQITPQKEAAA